MKKGLFFFFTAFLFVFLFSNIVMADNFFPSKPIVKIGGEYGSKYFDLFDEELEDYIEYNFKNFQIQLIQEIFTNLFWNFKYKIQDYNYFSDSSKDKVVNYFYNNLKIRMIKNIIFSCNINFKYENYIDNLKDYYYLYPGLSFKWKYKKSSYLYFSYHLYYRFGASNFYDYQIHRFYFTLKYRLNSIDLKLYAVYNYQINFKEEVEIYNKFTIGAFVTYDFNK